MLTLRSVQTSYGSIKALRSIDLEVRRGEIVCLLGSNGAGKTTTLMTISGILRPDKGEIIFEEESLTSITPSEIVRKGICQVPEGRRIFPKLSVRDNLEMGAFSVPAGDEERNLDRVFSIFPILKERARQMSGTLSGGEQQMLAIGRSLMSNPKMLLLDEPSLGLAPIMVSKIFRIIQEINKEGMTVLLVEQNARAALRLSNRGYVLENGTIQLSGTGDELLGNENVKKAYLGV
jgi:branched-chain amino acid transport system ATP-binding protein